MQQDSCIISSGCGENVVILLEYKYKILGCQVIGVIALVIDQKGYSSPSDCGIIRSKKEENHHENC
jgi:hypothetical protein